MKLFISEIKNETDKFMVSLYNLNITHRVCLYLTPFASGRK